MVSEKFMATTNFHGVLFFFTNRTYRSNSTDLFYEDAVTESTTLPDIDLDDITLTVEDYSYISLYLSMAVLGVILNTFTLLTVGCGRHIDSKIKIQLMNLAFADLLMALFDPPDHTKVVYRNLSFPGNTAACKLYQFACGVSHYATLFCNAAISLERFVIIFFPFRAARYRKVHRYIVILLIWICAVLPAYPSLIQAEVIRYYDSSFCLIVQASRNQYSDADLWTPSLFALVPALVIVAIYAMIFIKLCIRRISPGVRQHSTGRWKTGIAQVCCGVSNQIQLRGQK